MAYLRLEIVRLPAHTPGAPKGEDCVKVHGREPGRDNAKRSANGPRRDEHQPAAQEPIDPRMPHMPPA